MASSWVTPQASRRRSRIHGLGLVAEEPIDRGDVVAVKWGELVDRATLADYMDVANDNYLPITDSLCVAPVSQHGRGESMIYINHSCQPNVGLMGNVVLVARRLITRGEELTIDYATFLDGAFRMDCKCGAARCRRVVRGTDWRNPSFRRRTGPYLAPYLRARVQRGLRRPGG